MVKKNFKYFNGYKGDKNLKALCKFLPKWVYIQKCLMMKVNICLYFIKEDELLKKYNKIWHKVSNSIKRGSDIEPVFNGK